MRTKMRYRALLTEVPLRGSLSVLQNKLCTFHRSTLDQWYVDNTQYFHIIEKMREVVRIWYLQESNPSLDRDDDK